MGNKGKNHLLCPSSPSGNGSHYSAASSSQPARGYSKGYGDQQPAKSYSKGHGDQQPAKGYSKGYGDQQPAKGSKKGPQPGKGPSGKANKYPDVLGDLTRGAGSRARRDARRALQAAGLPIPETLKPGKAVDDLDPQSREEAKDLQRRLKELTWSSSLPARVMQLEIANVKQKLKELLSEKNDKDEEEEEESDKPSTPSSPSSSSDHPTPRLKSFQEVQRAELEKAQAELEKAKADLEAAENRLERKKRKKKEKKRKENEESEKEEEEEEEIEEEKEEEKKEEPGKADAEKSQDVEMKKENEQPDESAWC